MSDFRFVEKLAGALWLCTPEHLERLHGIFVERLDRAAAGKTLDVEAIEREIGRPLDNTRQVTIRGGVARIPVEGTIMRRASLFTAMSGGVSTDALMKDFHTAYADPLVHSILFVFDSPGGEAYGIRELAAAIREKRDLGEKRIEAYCGELCASAAYWLASATSRITVDATASLGSIGVVTTVRNPDAAGKGQDVEIVSSTSPQKRPNPNTETGRATIQAWIDDMAAEFIEAVADNRGVTFEKVVEDFGQGFVMIGRRAVAAGMADELGSEEGVIASLIERERRPVGIAAVAASADDSGAKEEQVTEQVAEQQRTTEAAEQPEQAEQPEEAVGLFRRLGAALGITVVDAAVLDASGAQGGAQETTDTEGEETDSGMSETATQTTSAAEATEEGREDQRSLSSAEREELLRLRAEHETREAENVRLAAALRERGIAAMLDARGTFDLGDGKRGAMPKAQRDAAETLIQALAAAGEDVVDVSATGEATLKDTPAGKAVANLVTDWKPVELGERGTIEGEARSEGAQGDDERIRAELSERGLGMEHYGAVAAELAAKGEIRREA